MTSGIARSIPTIPPTPEPIKMTIRTTAGERPVRLLIILGEIRAPSICCTSYSTATASSAVFIPLPSAISTAGIPPMIGPK